MQIKAHALEMTELYLQWETQGLEEPYLCSSAQVTLSQNTDFKGVHHGGHHSYIFISF